MNPIDIETLERLAKAATPGTYYAENADSFAPEEIWLYAEQPDWTNFSIAAIRRGCEEAGNEKQNAADAEYFAALSPSVVLALISRLREAEAKWQPIETAPKDYTAILTADARGSVITGWWQEDVWHTGWVSGGHRSDVEEIEPTHWMPLPKAPAANPTEAGR